MIGRKRSRQARRIASRGSTASRRDVSIARSIMMIAFFFTMPISRITPINAMIVNSVLNACNANTAPTPADGSVDRIVIG